MYMIALNSFNTKVEDKITINYFLLSGLSLFIFLNLLSITISGLAIVLAIIENILIYYFLLSGKNKRALLYMFVFYATNYGNPVFFGTGQNIDTIYYVESVPLLHGYLAIFSFFILYYNVFSSKITKINNSNILETFAYYTFIVGTIMGLFTIVINGFQYRAIISDINQCIIPAMMILVFFKLFKEDPIFLNKYLSLAFHIILSYIVIAWVTSTLGIYANFVDVREKVLMLPIPSFYITSIILFIGLMKTGRDRIVVIIAFLSTVYFQLFFDSCMNGKSWFVFVTTLLVVFYYLANNARYKLFSYAAVAVIMIASLIYIAPKVDSYISDTENTKLLEFVSVFEAVDSGSLDDMDQSSRFRFIEFINVAEQYLDQPLFALPGRGYGGSIHSNGYFVVRSESGFSNDQYDTDKFYRLHESVNVIFLKFGIIGLVFLVIILINLIKGIKISPWCYIGLIWVLFFWGYQNSLLFFGVPAVVIGFIGNNSKNTLVVRKI